VIKHEPNFSKAEKVNMVNYVPDHVLLIAATILAARIMSKIDGRWSAE